MRYRNLFRFLSACLLALLALAGCTSAPATHYYVLDSVHPQKKEQPSKPGMVAVLHLEIPRYLDRPRIVRRDAGNQLHISEYHQWGGRLRDNIARILSDNLSERLGVTTVSTASLPGSMDARISLFVDIRKFELLSDGFVHLVVRWHILSRGKVIQSSLENLQSDLRVEEHDYAGMAAAMSRLLGHLSENIAAGVRSVENHG